MPPLGVPIPCPAPRTACSLDYATVITETAAHRTLAVGLLHTPGLREDSAVCQECQVIYLRYVKLTDELTLKRRDCSLLYAASEMRRLRERTKAT